MEIIILLPFIPPIILLATASLIGYIHVRGAYWTGYIKGYKDGVGNAVVPQQAYPIFKAIMSIEKEYSDD